MLGDQNNQKEPFAPSPSPPPFWSRTLNFLAEFPLNNHLPVLI